MMGRIISHYKILHKYGEGIIGAVYEAEDTNLDGIVVLRFLPPELIKAEKQLVALMGRDSICNFI